MMRLLLLCGLLGGTMARAAAEAPVHSFEFRWKLQSRGVWPPAVSGDRAVVKTGDSLAAYSVSSGRLLWSQRLNNLRLGEGTVAAGDQYLYVLSDKGLLLLDLASGKLVGSRDGADASGVLYHNGSVYLASAAGLQRFDASASKLLQQAAGYQGELRGADGDYVAIFRQQESKKGKASPQRLTVVNLGSGKVQFEFKLLPTGWHRVAHMGEGRISFIDYTRRRADGSNSRKLYYTEADYLRGKKLRDISLASKYSSSSADVFWIHAAPSGRVYLANHGAPGTPSTLFAFDPVRGKTLWTRSGEVAEMGLLLDQDRLWTGIAGQSGEGQLVAYSPETGDVISRLPLDAAGTGVPVLAADALLVRTRTSIYCLAPQRGLATVPPPVVQPTPPASSNGWQLFRDRVAGYVIQVPKSWSFNRKGMRKLGGLRFVIPFVRSGGPPTPLATVHILTWEAAGRDAPGLWKSVLAQRTRSNPETKVKKVRRIRAQGHAAGPPAVLATYTFANAGKPVKMRSLCLISHGVAFELRAWAAAGAPEEVWAEVAGIFKGFQPRPPGTL